MDNEILKESVACNEVKKNINIMHIFSSEVGSVGIFCSDLCCKTPMHQCLEVDTKDYSIDYPITFAAPFPTTPSLQLTVVATHALPGGTKNLLKDSYCLICFWLTLYVTYLQIHRLYK